MKKTLALVTILLSFQIGLGQVTAFEGALGGGAYATGGRGGPVYHVTNLNNSGTGSFRTAVSNAAANDGNVVFDVSGTIHLTSNLLISGDNFSIWGQTAPEGGITLTSNSIVRIYAQDINNVIMRYIRIRPYESPWDAFEFYGNTQGAYNIISDHMSIAWGGDESYSLRGALTHNHTLQRSMIVDGKTGSLWGDSSTPANSHSNSVLFCLYANISHRVPNMATTARGDIINNVVQNHQYRLTFTNGGAQLNYINNYVAMGASTSLQPGSQGQGNQASAAANNQIYSAGTYIDKGILTDPLANNEFIWYEFNGGQSQNPLASSEFVSTAYSIIGPAFTPMSATDAYTSVLADVGANAYLNADGSVGYHHDAIDTHHLNAMAGGEGSFFPYQMFDDVRSWFDESLYNNFIAAITTTPINERGPTYDTDGDGVPDLYETAQGWNPNVFDSDVIMANGRSRLEKFVGEVDQQSNIAVTGITWGNDNQTVNVGGALDLNYTFSPSNATDQGFSLASNNTSVVSNTGAVVGVGTATLTITTDDGGFSDDMSVTVNAAPSGNNGKGTASKSKLVKIIN